MSELHYLIDVPGGKRLSLLPLVGALPFAIPRPSAPLPKRHDLNTTVSYQSSYMQTLLFRLLMYSFAVVLAQVHCVNIYDSPTAQRLGCPFWACMQLILRVVK